MKKALLTIVAIAAATSILNAGTYTWTGAANDGLWFTAGNWNYDDGSGNVTSPAASAPGNTCADDVVISGDGVVVEYVPGGDWNMQGTITISNGAKLVQTTGGNYATISGTMILDGGTYDAGTCTGLTLNGRLVVCDGGELVSNVALGRGSSSILELHGGSVPTYSGNYVLANYPNDVYDGGTFTLTNELQPPSGDRIWDGTHWVCKMFSPRGAGAHTFKSGSLTTTTTSYNGYYQNNSYINVPSDSTASFTWNYKASEIYSKLWSGNSPRFRYEGSVLTEEEFESLFECVDDNGKAPCTFQLIPLSDTMPVFGSSSVVLGDASDAVVASASFTNPGTPSASVYLAWGTSDLGRKMSDWGANVAELGTASLSTQVSSLVSGLPTNQMLTFRIFATTSEGETAVSDAKTIYMHYYGVEGIVNEWLGTQSTSLTLAGNWSLGHVPTDDEIRWFGDSAVNPVEHTGSFTPRASDVFRGGEIIESGELRFLNGTVLSGTAFEGKILAPQSANSVITAIAGSVRVTYTGNNGFWQSGSTYINIPSGSTASFTFPFPAENIYSITFGSNASTPKFRYNGSVLSESEFASLFTVVAYEYADGETTGSTFYLTPMSESAASFADAGVTAARERGSLDVTFSAAIASAGDPAAVVTVYYGTTNGGILPESWDQSVELGVAVDNGTLSQTVSLQANTTYYFAACATNEAGAVWAAGESFITTDIPLSPTNTWLGAVSTDSRVAGNWSLGHVPTSAESVAVIDVFASRDLSWYPETAATVVGWNQMSYAGRSVLVTFFTTKESGLVVAGDVVLASGNWTHKGPADEPEYCLNVSVSGNMSVGSGAIVQAGTAQENNSDYRPRGYRQGPGYLTSTKMVIDPDTQEEVEETVYFGGSYAGDGGHVPYAGPFPSYGSILNPMEWGSAGKGDSVDNYSGAGLIILTVFGNLTVDGSIASHGFGWDGQRAGASGGSVNITAARLSGEGSINADGGRCLNGPGSGGRIRVKLTATDATFADFGAPAKIHANPGTFTNITGDSYEKDVVLGAAGTVTLQLAADNATSATVVVSDANQNRRDAIDATSLVSATHLPARLNPTENLKDTRWELLGYGKLRLTADARIAALSLAADDGTKKVYTDGHVLTTRSLVVNGARLRAGVYDATGTSWVSGSGSVTVSAGGFVFVVR